MIVDVGFGLVSRPLRDQGEPMSAALYASWERAHYAGEEICLLAHELIEFTAHHVPSMYGD